MKKYSFLRKEQLQPVRNEASLQADGTYTTNSRFDFFFDIYEPIISFNNYHICFKYHICRMIHDICLMIFISFPDSDFLIIQNLIIYNSLLKKVKKTMTLMKAGCRHTTAQIHTMIFEILFD